ncbi:MAG: hypothetical protein GY854_05650 [Deltaproteobacteria bacterium]|nr:hypothetical protein [Deltaproteobacteria bacterium]
MTSIALAMMLLPCALEAYGGHLGLGVEGGYVATGRDSGSPPEMVHGGALGAHITYGFTDSWGISLQGDVNWHTPYTVSVLGELAAEPQADTETDTETDTEEKTSVGYVEGDSVDASIATSVSLSLIYIVDVMRMQPFIDIGITGARVDQRMGDWLLTNFELGVRMGLGVDFMLFEYLGLGAAIYNDLYFIGDTDFSSRMEILARFTFFFDVGKLGRRSKEG